MHTHAAPSPLLRRQLQSAYDEMREKTNVLIAEVGVLKRAIQQFHNVTKFALDN